MKTAPEFDALVGHSHAVDTKVELRRADDTVVGVLPIESGSVRADAAARVGRWSGDLTIAGLEWAPTGVDSPLSGLSGHYVSVQRAGKLYGQQAPAWVEVVRLWPAETTVTMSRTEAELSVRLNSAGYLAAQAADIDYKVQPGESCQAMALRILRENLPYTPAVLDTSTSVDPPAHYETKQASPIQAVEDLMAVADARLFFDAQGRIVIRPVLTSLDVSTFTPVRTVGVDLDVTRYQLRFGRDTFVNDVVIRFGWEEPDGGRQERDGTARITTGPGRVGGPAGKLTYVENREITASQAEADKFAAAVLDSLKQGWCEAQITAVQDPRLELDDIIDVTYLDRTLRHRVTALQFDLRTDAMSITARTALPAGSP